MATHGLVLQLRERYHSTRGDTNGMRIRSTETNLLPVNDSHYNATTREVPVTSYSTGSSDPDIVGLNKIETNATG